jgi:hypothetical protein
MLSTTGSAIMTLLVKEMFPNYHSNSMDVICGSVRTGKGYEKPWSGWPNCANDRQKWGLKKQRQWTIGEGNCNAPISYKLVQNAIVILLYCSHGKWMSCRGSEKSRWDSFCPLESVHVDTTFLVPLVWYCYNSSSLYNDTSLVRIFWIVRELASSFGTEHDIFVG